jgi:hypothetical protein
MLWCERGDSNPHGFTRQILSLVRLPIPPLSQIYLPHPGSEETSARIFRRRCLWQNIALPPVALRPNRDSFMSLLLNFVQLLVDQQRQKRQQRNS